MDGLTLLEPFFIVTLHICCQRTDTILVLCTLELRCSKLQDIITK